MSKRDYSLDLIKQMAECDANYIRLLKLVPELWVFRSKCLTRKKLQQKKHNPDWIDLIQDSDFINSGSADLISLEAGLPIGKIAEFGIVDENYSQHKLVVEISVIESFKYTTTLEIVQKPQTDNWLASPTMQVRVYHDASTAEVTSYQNHRNFKPRYSQPNPQMYQRDEKMQVNSFLGEWLTYCLKAGQCLKAPDIIIN